MPAFPEGVSAAARAAAPTGAPDGAPSPVADDARRLPRGCLDGGSHSRCRGAGDDTDGAAGTAAAEAAGALSMGANVPSSSPSCCTICDEMRTTSDIAKRS